MNPCVLIVEDCDVQRELLADHLTLKGFETQSVGCLGDAMRVYSPDTHAAVLLDLGLPDSAGGTDTLFDFKRIHPCAKVVAITGNTEIGKNDVLAAGALGFVNKCEQSFCGFGERLAREVRTAIAAGRCFDTIRELRHAYAHPGPRV